MLRVKEDRASVSAQVGHGIRDHFEILGKRCAEDTVNVQIPSLAENRDVFRIC